MRAWWNWEAMRAPPVADEASRARGSGRQDPSLLCQAKGLPGTATGRLGGFRCCHLSEGFSVPLSLRTSAHTGVAIRSLKAGLPVLYIVDQGKRSTSGTSPCKNQRYNSICGHGGIGRLGGFRFHCESVQVRVLLPAPKKERPKGLSFFGANKDSNPSKSNSPVVER